MFSMIFYQTLKSSPGDQYLNLDAKFHSLEEAILGRIEDLERAEWTVARWPVLIFIAAACFCMVMSALCHSLYCCAKHISQNVWQLDYLGITALIVCSMVPPVYYGFACHTWLRNIYLSIAVFSGVSGMVMSLVPYFKHRGFHYLRAGTYVSMALWGVIPLIHLVYVNEDFESIWDELQPHPVTKSSRTYLIGEVVHDPVKSAAMLIASHGAVYLIGAAMYAFRFPERYFPGKLNIVGSSHQLFHLSVVIAAYLHYESVILLMHWREIHACPMLT